MKDSKAVVDKAARYVLLVDTYIGHPTDLQVFGIPENIKHIAKEMETISVDMIGMSYEGVEAGKVHPKFEERVKVLVETATTSTLAEGGINLENYKAFRDLGVNIIVGGTAIDKYAEKAVRTFLS